MPRRGSLMPIERPRGDRFVSVRAEMRYHCIIPASAALKERKSMRAPFPAKLCLLVLLAAAAAQAQAQSTPPDADAIKSSLAEILSFATLGTVTTQPQAVEVTRSGADYLVRLPLKGFSTPPDAAVNAVARPLDGGMWDIASMTFPSAGTVETVMPHAGASRFTYSISEQTLHGQIDPGFVHPSSFAADLGDVKVHSELGAQRTEQNFEHYAVDGTVTAEPSGGLDLASRAKATNWHLTAHAPNGVDTEAVVRALSGHFSVEGLDRAQGTRLMAAARALLARAQASTSTPGSTPGLAPDPVPGQPPTISAEQRRDLRAMVDAASGLLTRFESDEALDDVRVTAGPTRSATIGHVRVDMTGDSANDRLNAAMDVALNDFAMEGLPAETAVYVPHQFGMKSVLAGVRTGPLMALLRAATEPNADPVALQAQFMALIGDADTRIGIESLTFDSGPMHVTGSMRAVQRANGQLGADIHVAATGVDALIAQAQGKPALQQVLPVMFMAKGMGRPDGGALVWDISLGDGPMTVNGIPFGQPAARRR
jgi:hypothetical protein